LIPPTALSTAKEILMGFFLKNNHPYEYIILANEHASPVRVAG
jgi:hypothetical protein